MPDKGHPFEVRVLDYPEQGWNIVGYASCQEKANQMGQKFMAAPGAGAFIVTNRHLDKKGEK